MPCLVFLTYVYMYMYQHFKSMSVCTRSPTINHTISKLTMLHYNVIAWQSEQYVTRGTICYTCVYITPQQIHVIPAVHWPPMAGVTVHVHTILCPHLSSYYYHFTCQQPEKISAELRHL